MQIIIPMSGFGERFRRAGYNIPKPLIEVEGKPIIAHVINLFSKNDNFIFVVNEDHLNEPKFKLKEILNYFCPNGRVISIPKHKLGPVYAINQIKEFISLEEKTIVNYCDFSCYWNYDKFLNFLNKYNPDGVIPSYKGFHPHSLGKTNYAYLQEENYFAYDIREKKPFTRNKLNEFASSGTYYFKTGKLMIDAFSYLIKNNLKVGGEYYVSLAYKYLFNKKQNVLVYELEHFMQWGTPEDLEEYLSWSNTFKRLLKFNNKEIITSSIIIPMAGKGKRFVDKGYKKLKPLIPVSGKEMIIQALSFLPRVSHYSFAVRSNMDLSVLKKIKTKDNIIVNKKFSKDTNGQATSAKIALDKLLKFSGKIEEPIIIGACDHGSIYNKNKLIKLINDDSVDIIVWGKRKHANAIRNPKMFGWIQEKDNKINKISVKEPLSNPLNDAIIIGTFVFKKSLYFRQSYEELIKNKNKINGEYYIDSCINEAISLGLNCILFEIEHLISWGTPDEFETFKYWQSCFHKWEFHPYRIENDNMIPEKEKIKLKKEYSKFSLKEI